ncbi:MAG: hypothetical protein NC936_05845, partial [Candidatus Omnitrophica bacterium]|nr:hypothetical protein [Candidatus Omnitrophota bacterium]
KKINALIEDFIREHPEEYLWYYKRWKRSPQKSIIILNDGRESFLKKCEEKLKEIQLEHKDLQFDIRIINISFKNGVLRKLLDICALFSSAYCQGCMSCVRFCLAPNSYREFTHCYADMIIAPRAIKSAAQFLSRENLAQIYWV